MTLILNPFIIQQSLMRPSTKTPSILSVSESVSESVSAAQSESGTGTGTGTGTIHLS